MLSSINVVTKIKNMCHAIDLERENTENVKYKRDVGRAGISGEIPIIPNLLDWSQLFLMRISTKNV